MTTRAETIEDLTALREALRAEALRLGFARAGFTSAEPLSGAQQRRWERWRAEGKAGEMRYLLRESPRRTHTRDLLPEAQSALVVLAGYFGGDHGVPPADQGAAGKIARYAWGRDYHLVLREKLELLGRWLEEKCGMRNAECGINLGARTPSSASPPDHPHLSWRACVDSAPLDERALAVRAGLGFIGKNTLLLDPARGSWAVIGVLLLSLPLPPDPPLRGPGLRACGDCRRCIEACPTGALSAPWRLDPRRCLSYLTVERKDEIPPELDARRRPWVLGCDRCQEVCPFNREPLARVLPELAASAGAGPWLTEARLAAFASGKAFRRALGQTPLARPGLKSLSRNLKS